MKKAKITSQQRSVVLDKNKAAVRLSKGQAALITVLRRKNSYTKTTQQICDDAGVEISTYYRAFQDEKFQKVLKQECQGLLNAVKLPLMQRMAHEALTNKSHHWAKMVAEMSDIYVPGGKGTTKPVEINFVVNMPRPQFEATQVETIEVS